MFCGLTGGTACGKTSVCKKVIKGIENVSKDVKIVIISQDNYYLETDIDPADHDWDHPNAIDWDLMFQNISDLKHGKPAQMPEWDFVNHCRKAEMKTVQPADIYLLEGILILTNEDVRNLLDLKVFIDVDADTRLSRRIIRDVKERGRSVDSVLEQYHRFVKPGFDNYIFPTRRHADLIIPRGAENQIAIDLLVKTLSDSH
jgi:uridine kinase